MVFSRILGCSECEGTYTGLGGTAYHVIRTQNAFKASYTYLLDWGDGLAQWLERRTGDPKPGRGFESRQEHKKKNL